MFTHEVRIGLHDTDAAGVLFFANQFRLAHQAYEAFLTHLGLPLRQFLGGRIVLPIVHAASDFARPVRVGDRVLIEVAPEEVGRSSFCIRYRLLNSQGQVVGTAQTVHVAVQRRNLKKTNLPPALRRALTATGP